MPSLVPTPNCGLRYGDVGRSPASCASTRQDGSRRRETPGRRVFPSLAGDDPHERHRSVAHGQLDHLDTTSTPTTPCAVIPEVGYCSEPWKGLGSGVLELVESHDGNAYRAVYTVRFAEVVYVLHAFQKKSPSGIRTAKRDLDLVADRLKPAQKDHEEQYGKSKR